MNAAAMIDSGDALDAPDPWPLGFGFDDAGDYRVVRDWDAVDTVLALGLLCGWSSRWMGQVRASGEKRWRAASRWPWFRWASVCVVAHFSFRHLATGWRSIEPSDWPLVLHYRPVRGGAGRRRSRAGSNRFQILMLDAGLLFSLYVAWRLACRRTARPAQALAMLAPWAVLAIGFYARLRSGSCSSRWKCAG